MAEHGLNQKQVADAAGVSEPAVSKWMNGSYPGAEELFKLASKHGETVEWFLNPQKEGLTNKVYSLTSSGVQPVLPKLIGRLKNATSERGQKIALAKWLGVHRQCVTDWLSGKQEPGGEITLRLLKWVEQQERKKMQTL